MATFDGSSLEEWADSLGAGRSVDTEIAEALGEVEARNANKGGGPAGGRQVPLPPKRLFGEVRPAPVKGQPDELWAWSEVDGKLYERPHPATNDEAMALQRGTKIPQAGFQQMGDAPAAVADKTLWEKIPTWVKVTAAGVAVVGGTLLVEHYAVPKVKELIYRKNGEDDEVIDVEAEEVDEMPTPAELRLLLAATEEGESQD